MGRQIREKILRFIYYQGKAVDYEILRKRFKYFYIKEELRVLRERGYIKIRRPLTSYLRVKIVYLTRKGINYFSEGEKHAHKLCSNRKP